MGLSEQGQGRGVFGAQPRAGALELEAAARVRVSPALWLLLLMFAQLVLWAVGTRVLTAPAMEKLPCDPQTGKVESGRGELPGLFTVFLFPPTFLPFSPSSPSPSLSHCSISHHGPPATFLPPHFCSSLSVTVTRVTVTETDGDVSPADALADALETQCLRMPWPAVLPAQSQASHCPCTGMDPRWGPLQAGTKLGLSLAWGRL